MTCRAFLSVLDRFDSAPLSECAAALRHVRECSSCRAFVEAGAAEYDSHATADDVRAADELAGRLAQHVINDPEA